MNAEAIFHDALARPQAERPGFLDAACAGDESLQRRVESLLHAHENPGSFLAEQPPLPAATIDAAISERPGTVIGPYKLLQQIGEGGMGVVWMAEQTQPVQRKVALKVIKPGMDSSQVIARFEAERQALAMMDHVNIARVLDAGTTESGLPYFVMELVHGVPITKYCDDNHLTPRERLEVFVPVCQAIQHAHQKGIIHRDIKPSNVMVTLYDGKPVPKVIDFGVAKATEQKLTERTLFTQYGTLVGTLGYMSPEQAEVNALGVDTRSDIYSLGVLLYELLTGSTPLDRKRMKEAAYAEILRLIKEEEPPKPSTRLSDSGESLASISAQRHMEPAKLTKLVRGELDWIVMKALEKDRNRRYETANAFVADVQCYLCDEAVLACPPSRWYRFGKFARRHKAALLAAAATVVVVVLGVAGLVASNVLIRQEQARTQSASNKLKENLRLALQALDEINVRLAREHLNKDPKGRGKDEELLKKALAFYERFAEQNSDDPDVRREMSLAYSVAGNINEGLGQHARAKQAHERAIAIAEQLTAEYPNNPDYRWLLGHDLIELASALLQAGDPRGGAQHARRAFDIRKRLADEYPNVLTYRQDLAEAYNGVGVFSRRLGAPAEAVSHFRQAVDIHTRLATEGLNTPLSRYQRARAHVNLGGALRDRNDPEQVEHWWTAMPLYADLIARADQDAELPVRERPPVPNRCRRDLATTHLNIARYLKDKQDPAAAEHLARSAALLAEVVDDVPNVARYRAELVDHLLELGGLLVDGGRRKDAAEPYRKAVEHLTRLVADHPDQARFPDKFAWFLATCPESRLREPDRAVEFAKKATKAAPEMFSYWNTLGVAHYRAGDWRAAAEALEKSMQMNKGGDACDWLFLAMAEWKLGNEKQAGRWYEQAVRAIEENKPLSNSDKQEVGRFRKEAEELMKKKSRID